MEKRREGGREEGGGAYLGEHGDLSLKAHRVDVALGILLQHHKRFGFEGEEAEGGRGARGREGAPTGLEVVADGQPEDAPPPEAPVLCNARGDLPPLADSCTISQVEPGPVQL